MADLLREASLTPRYIEKRVKDRDRLEQKIRERGTSVDNWAELHAIGDLAGVRAVFRYRDEVEQAAAALRSEFKIHADQPYGFIDLDPRQFGYTTWQLTVSFDHNRCSRTEFREHRDKRGEIQLRTLLQHAWAEHSHTFHYRHFGSRPLEIERRLARLAALVEVADHEMLGLREDLRRLQNEYKAKVRRRAFRKMELNVDSLESYLDAHPLDDVFDIARSVQYDDSGVPPPGDIAMFVKYATMSGLSTVADVRSLARSVPKRRSDLERVRGEALDNNVEGGPSAQPLEVLIFLLILDSKEAAELLERSPGDFGPRMTRSILAARLSKALPPK